MELFAKMGGAPLPVEGDLLIGGICLILPLVILLATLAVYRNSPGIAWNALLLAGLPLLVLLPLVAGYEPSDDEHVLAAQAGGRLAVGLYAGLTTIAGLSVVWLVRGQDGNVKSE